MNLPLTSLNNHTSNTFNRNLNDSNNLLLSNRSASTMLSPSNLAATANAAAAAAAAVVAAGSMPTHQPISNEHLYSTLYGRELELMRKIYKGDNRDHLVESPLMQSPHQQQHTPDATRNAGYPMNYPNAQFGVGVPNSPYHHAMSPSRTPPKVHHPDQIMSPDNARMIKQEEKPVVYHSPPSGYPYGAPSMSPTSILSNMAHPMARKFDPEILAGMSAHHKQMYEDRKLHLNAAYPNKDHMDPSYGDNMYADVMNAPNSNVNNFIHLQQEHEKQSHQRQQQQQQPNTTKHNNTGQLIGSESNSHFYNISDYESNDKRQQHHSSHQLFQQNQFSINNTPKDNGGGLNMTGLTEKSPINNATSKLNNACSHSDSNNNNNNNSNNDNAKNVRMAAKFSAANSSNANENAPFESAPCRSAKMGPKSIKSDGTSKINAGKVNNSNSATNLLSHSKCPNETANDFMLHIRVKEQKQLQQQQQQQQQMQNANGRMTSQRMDFDETSNSCESPGNEDASTYNDDEGDEFMNL